MNYLHFFRFSEEPFRLTPDRDFYFQSADQRSIAEVIRFALEQGEGFITVIGEVGTGKTMLLRYLASSLFCNYETAMLISPQLSPRELVQAILQDVGLQTDAHDTINQLLSALNEYLFQLSQQGKRLVIIIDEAQDLPMESLEQIRLLSNFETDKHKWLQILLVGQPELQEKINSAELRQLRQRITISETLHPHSSTEMRDYVHFRLKRAGRADLRLNDGQMRLLYRYSGGIPRLVHKLLSRTLLVMYGDKKHSFDKKSIKAAASSLGMAPQRRSSFWGVMQWAAGLAVFMLILNFL